MICVDFGDDSDVSIFTTPDEQVIWLWRFIIMITKLSEVSCRVYGCMMDVWVKELFSMAPEVRHFVAFGIIEIAFYKFYALPFSAIVVTVIRKMFAVAVVDFIPIRVNGDSVVKMDDFTEIRPMGS